MSTISQKTESSDRLAFDFLGVLPGNIPQSLKDHPYWAAWIAKPKDNGKFKKIPVNVETGEWLSTTDTAGWVSFEKAYSAYTSNNKYQGIGILLTPEDRFIGIDIDDCMDDDSPHGDLAEDILENINTYTELSPSGKGIRCIGKRGRTNFELNGNRVDWVEFYTQHRFLTITGQTGIGMPTEIRRCPTSFQKLHRKYIIDGRQTNAKASSTDKGTDTTPSGKDFAFSCSLAEQGLQADEIKQRVLTEGKNQEKYLRPDYLDRTIQAALDKVKRERSGVTSWRDMPVIDFLAVSENDFIPTEWLVEPLIRKDTYVGQIVGEQQVGKSYFITVLVLCLACGRSYGPFTMPEPRKVIYLNVEDPASQIHNRCKHITQELKFSAEELALISKNLKILPWMGRFGAIMQDRGTPTPPYQMLMSMVDDLQPDLVIGDTKSRLSGGEENSNDVQAALVRLLEELVIRYRGVFLMVHHPGKSDKKGSRGGSAWESNVRLTITLVKKSDNTFTMTSSDNYGKSTEALFRKDHETGFPRPEAPQVGAGEAVEKWLRQALKEHAPVNKRNLTQCRRSDDTVATMLDSFPDDIKGDKKTLISEAVDRLIENDRAYEVKDGKSIVLEVKKPATMGSERKKDEAE